MKGTRKIIYIAFTGLLTSMAMSACYWQSSKYLVSRKHWSVISKQLSQQNPKNFKQFSKQQRSNLHAFKYIQMQGKISPQCQIITRARGMRTGYLVLRKLQYKGPNNQDKQIIALGGWCPQGYAMEDNQQQINANNNKDSKQPKKDQKFRGILRKKQVTDYLHTKMKQSDLQKYKLNTWIDLQKYLQTFNITPDQVNTNFYYQILKPTSSTQEQQQLDQYPYKYSVDNFQLPYLTPQKHQAYAAFWFCTSLVGWGAIIKVLKMK